MKKIIAMVLAVLLVVCIAGCGNMGIGLGSFTYGKVHIDTLRYSGCLTVEKWYENESGVGVEVMTSECGALFLSEGTYIMIDGSKGCHFCESIAD